jgi:hypothetical protein
MGVIYKVSIIDYSVIGLCRGNRNSGGEGSRGEEDRREKEEKKEQMWRRENKCNKRWLGKLKFQQNGKRDYI